jgi:outer membrane lipoprotein-sorting protein
MEIPLKDHRPKWKIVLLGAALWAAGCAVSQKRVVAPAEVRTALEASKSQLLEQYNQQASAIETINAAVSMTPTTGSAYSGVIEQYHDVNGFILARKPADIRVIGQAPVVSKNIFDMVSDGQTFRIFIPSKNKFITGPTRLERPASKAIENLRPQHLLDVFFWPPATRPGETLFEEWNDATGRYYILTMLGRASEEWHIERKVWFDRTDLSIARIQTYDDSGKLLAEICYAEWTAAGKAQYPAHIWLARPHDDYQLEIRITRATLNESVGDERFKLAQPEGSELVRVGEGAEAKQ